MQSKSYVQHLPHRRAKHHRAPSGACSAGQSALYPAATSRYSRRTRCTSARSTCACSPHRAQWESWPAYLEEAECGERPREEDFMEARTLQGLVLGMLPVSDFSDYLTHLSHWVRVIHSWSVCDSLVSPSRRSSSVSIAPSSGRSSSPTSSTAGSTRCASASSPSCSTSSTMSI